MKAIDYLNNTQPENTVSLCVTLNETFRCVLKANLRTRYFRHFRAQLTLSILWDRFRLNSVSCIYIKYCRIILILVLFGSLYLRT